MVALEEAWRLFDEGRDCRYHQCQGDGAPCDAGAGCYRDRWICGDFGDCPMFDRDSITCATYLTCQAGAWACAP